jgi:hypothetical protein
MVRMAAEVVIVYRTTHSRRFNELGSSSDYGDNPDFSHYSFRRTSAAVSP